jgi:hypothetical protein
MQGSSAGGRRARHRPRHVRPIRRLPTLARRFRLVRCHRSTAGAGAARGRDLRRALPWWRRVDQLHGLVPGPPPRLRRVGRGGYDRLELGGRAAAVPAQRGPRARRLGMARNRWSHRHHDCAGHLSTFPSLHHRRRRLRASAEPRLQRQRTGRRWPPLQQRARRRAQQRGPGLLTSRREPAQPDRAHGSAGEARPTAQRERAGSGVHRRRTVRRRPPAATPSCSRREGCGALRYSCSRESDPPSTSARSASRWW